MDDSMDDDRSLDELGTPADIRATAQPQPAAAPQDSRVTDPHGASDAISGEEYVGRREGLQGLWDSLAYRVQLIGLSVYGPAPQSADTDPVQRLKRKYGRVARSY